MDVYITHFTTTRNVTHSEDIETNVFVKSMHVYVLDSRAMYGDRNFSYRTVWFGFFKSTLKDLVRKLQAVKRYIFSIPQTLEATRATGL